MSKKADDLKYFWTDAELYFLWQFTTNEYLPFNEHGMLHNGGLTPEKNGYLWRYLKKLDEIIDIDELYNLHLYTDTQKLEYIVDLKSNLGWHSKAEQKKITKILERIESLMFSYTDIVYVEDLMPTSLYSDIYLTEKKDPSKWQIQLKQAIDDYIVWYINWDLLVDKTNYFNFHFNQEIFVQMIQKVNVLNKFWRNFIISSDENFPWFYKNSQALFVHTVYALQYLWYFQVLDISVSFKERDWWAFDTIFHINILPNDSFRSLIYQEFQKENPETVIIWYDWKTWTLNFAGKEIIIGKSGKETDARLLLWTLMKASWDEYMHNDEIYDDWGFNEADQKKATKKKIYFAWVGINKVMQLEAWIDDFLEVTTTKVRINPKYRKN